MNLKKHKKVTWEGKHYRIIKGNAFSYVSKKEREKCKTKNGIRVGKESGIKNRKKQKNKK